MCNKIQYPTEQHAKDAALAMSKKKGQGMKYYFCWFCGVWHLMTKGRRKIKAKEEKHKHQLQKDYSINTLKKYSNGSANTTSTVKKIAHIVKQGRHKR
jgi:hypothetical protein